MTNIIPFPSNMTVPTSRAPGSNARPPARPTAPLVGSLSTSEAPAGAAESYARSLCLQVQAGTFGPALAELNAAPTLGSDAPDLVVKLRDTVAHELTRCVVDVYQELNLHPHALHALGVVPLLSEQLVVAPEGRRLHLVERRVAHGDVISEELHTACGQELWSDIDAPLSPGMRGSWQQPELFHVTRCADCAAHAPRFAAAQEHFEGPDMPIARGEALRDEVAGVVRAQLTEQMSDLAPLGGVEALEATDARYRDALTESLVAQARAGGDEVLKRVLLRYYDSARQQLEQIGCTTPLSELLSEEQWRELVAGLVADLHENRLASAQAYLFADMRSMVKTRIANEQMSFLAERLRDAGREESEA